MAAPAINRLVLTDDDGTGLTGTPLNNALFQDLQNRIDQLSAAIVAQFPASTSIITSATLPDAMQNAATARTLAAGNVGAVAVDRSSFDYVQIFGLAQPLTIGMPTWTSSGGVNPYDGAPLVYRIWDNGTPQTLTWNAGFVPMFGIPLPTATYGAGVGAIAHIAFRYRADNNTWTCVAMARA